MMVASQKGRNMQKGRARKSSKSKASNRRKRTLVVPDAKPNESIIGPYGVPDNRLQKQTLVEGEPL